MNKYDAIVIGAGSIGMPIAFNLQKEKLKVLVIDELPSPGQGQNKAAIGGVRATHSHFSKIKTCQRSIEVFKSWKETYGDDIGWLEGGYSFVAYAEELAEGLKCLAKDQKEMGLNIEWLDSKELLKKVPDIEKNGLIGGTFSPEDGSASPLLAMAAYFKLAKRIGVEFRFNEPVLNLIIEKEKVTGVKTSKYSYFSDVVVNAAGAAARKIAAMASVNLEVFPESHEAGITEPCRHLLRSMIVDMQKENLSDSCYFYQNFEGQVVFCITPFPVASGTDRREVSGFLPVAAARLARTMPKLANLRVRRTWRGLYPMTPDGFPFVGYSPRARGLFHAVGMCGQGFMLGSGIGEIAARVICNKMTAEDARILEGYSLERSYSASEVFK